MAVLNWFWSYLADSLCHFAIINLSTQIFNVGFLKAPFSHRFYLTVNLSFLVQVMQYLSISASKPDYSRWVGIVDGVWISSTLNQFDTVSPSRINYSLSSTLLFLLLYCLLVNYLPCRNIIFYKSEKMLSDSFLLFWTLLLVLRPRDTNYSTKIGLKRVKKDNLRTLQLCFMFFFVCFFKTKPLAFETLH